MAARWVVGYRVASETFNPINSVRIENLHVALKACTVLDCLGHERFRKGEVPPNANAAAVGTALDALDELDRKTVKNNIEMNQLAALNLAGSLRDRYFAL